MLFAMLLAAAPVGVWKQECGGSHFGGFPMACTTMIINADGSYRSMRASDYVERDETGRWQATSADTLTLTTKTAASKDIKVSTITWELTAGGLVFGGVKWRPSTSSLKIDLGQLADFDKTVRIERERPTLQKLTAHPWRKSDRFGLRDQPERLTLRPDSTYTASFRGGYEATGTFKLERERFALQQTPDDRCGRRGNDVQLRWGGRPVVTDSELQLPGATFVRDDGEAPPPFTDLFTRGLRGRLMLEQMPVAGERVRGRLLLDNQEGDELQLKSLTLRTRGLDADGNQTTPYVVRQTVSLTEKKLGRLQKLEVPIDFTISEPDAYALKVMLEYGDSKLEAEISFHGR